MDIPILLAGTIDILPGYSFTTGSPVTLTSTSIVSIPSNAAFYANAPLTGCSRFPGNGEFALSSTYTLTSACVLNITTFSFSGTIISPFGTQLNVATLTPFQANFLGNGTISPMGASLSLSSYDTGLAQGWQIVIPKSTTLICVQSYGCTFNGVGTSVGT